MKLDVLFINPGNARAIYQELAKDFSAIETRYGSGYRWNVS